MRFEYPGVTRDQAQRWRLKRIFKADDEIDDDADAAALASYAGGRDDLQHHHLVPRRCGDGELLRMRDRDLTTNN